MQTEMFSLRDTPAAIMSKQIAQGAAQDANPKTLIGAEKVNPSLVPPAGILHTAAAMMDGGAKYGPYNWREKAVPMMTYIAAAQRHLMQLLDGEDYDPTSRVHHAGHAAACMMIILDALEHGTLIDDRPLESAAGSMVRRFGKDTKFNT
jgi:hypothetical protein